MVVMGENTIESLSSVPVTFSKLQSGCLVRVRDGSSTIFDYHL